MNDSRAVFRRAGATAVPFNAPLSDARAAEILDWSLGSGSAHLVDLGCGCGELLVRAALRASTITGLGVDCESTFVAAGTARAAAAGVADRVRLVEGDATAWQGSTDVVVAIGATHAFGGIGRLLQTLARTGTGRAIVGDPFWDRAPDSWADANLGPLPTGLQTLTTKAVAAGWRVERAETSTLDEWDGFERGWVEGARHVGTPEARAFAAEREDQYYRHYRGVLGFAWLLLHRPVPALESSVR